MARSGLAPLYTAAFLAYTSYAICRTPLLPLFAQELGAGPTIVGLVVGSSTITGILVKMPAGALSDVLGRQRLLMAGALVFALAPFTYLGAASLAMLIALRVIHGNATAVFGPVASSAVSHLAPPAERGRWLSAYASVQGTGQALGPLIAGYLIATGGYDLAFIASGLIGVGAALALAGWSLEDPVPPTAARWSSFTTGLREVLGHRLVLLTSAAHAAQFVMNGSLSAFLPLYGRDVIGLTTPQLGWLFAAQTITTLAVRPLVGIASDRLGRRGAIVAGLATSSVALWSLTASQGPWLLAGAVMVYAAGVAATTAATSAFITDITRRARYGAAHGVFGTIYDVGDALGPIVAGLLVATLDYAWMFRVMGLVGIAAAAVFARASADA